MSSFASTGGGVCCFLSNPSAVKVLGPNPSTARGAGIHINVHPKENKIIYCSGKYVIVRSIDDQSDCFVYRGHNHAATVAKFSPNGFWVASADITGNYCNEKHSTFQTLPLVNFVCILYSR
jgi:WD40 repeat protein